MPDLAKIDAVASKLEGAEPASDPTTAPPDGGSGVGSAPSDPASGGHGPGPETEGATVDHAAMAAKLEADRERRAEKAKRRRIADEEAAAKKLREEAEADRKAAAEEKARYTDKRKSFRERILEAGEDPRKVFEEFRQEALKADTPEAKLEAIERAWQERLDGVEAKLKAADEAREAERKEREEERQKAIAERQEIEFRSDFQLATAEERYAPLLEEYEPQQLFRIVDALRRDPAHLFAQAEALGVDLQDADGSFTMIDIFNVCLTAQRRHAEGMQRRKQSAAPQTSQAGPKQPPSVNPTVNGTAVKNAGALGNHIATDRASEAGSPPRESRADRVKRLGEKWG